MPQASDTAMVNAATRRSRSGRDEAGKRHRALRDQQRRPRRARAAGPAAAPSAVSTQLSVISCRSSRPRPAPTAVRTAISRRRASDRAISRLATLAQAMSRTNATAAISVSSAGRSAPNSSTSSGLTSTPRFSLVLRVGAFELPRDAVQLGLRARERHARLEPRQRPEPAIAAAGHRLRRRVDGERHPQLGDVGEALEPGRHDADDGVGARSSASRCVPTMSGIGAEAPLPQPVAQDRPPGRRGDEILRPRKTCVRAPG